MKKDVAVLSSRGQLTLPASIRKRIDLHKGDKLNVYDVADRYIVIEKVEETPLEAVLERFERTAKQKKLKAEEVVEALRTVRKDIYRELYGPAS